MPTFFIEANEMSVVKFYFQLILFLFGGLTFLYGIHDNLLEKRERNSCYSVNFPPFLSFSALEKEYDFVKNGYFKPEEPKYHQLKKVDYFFLIDRTKSVDNATTQYFRKYLEKVLYNSYEETKRFIKKLNGPDLILAGILHQLSFVSDIDSVRINVMAYNGNDDFDSVLNGFRILERGYGNEAKRNQTVVAILDSLQRLPKPKNKADTYFNKVYGKINSLYEDNPERPNNLNVVILSDFDHEFNEINNQNELDNQIVKLEKFSKEFSKISLVELKTRSIQNNFSDSQIALKALKRRISKVNIYAWSFANLEAEPYNNINVFFNSIISIPAKKDRSIIYQRDINSDYSFLDSLKSSHYSMEVPPTNKSNSIISCLPCTRVCKKNELIKELSSTKYNFLKSTSILGGIGNNGFSSKEMTERFVPLNTLPRRSLDIFFIVYLLLFATLTALVFVYNKYLNECTTHNNVEYQGYFGKQYNAKFVLRIWMFSFLFLITLLFVPYLSTIKNLMGENYTWIPFGIGVLCFIIMPFQFYRLHKK